MCSKLEGFAACRFGGLGPYLVAEGCVYLGDKAVEAEKPRLRITSRRVRDAFTCIPKYYSSNCYNPDPLWYLPYYRPLYRNPYLSWLCSQALLASFLNASIDFSSWSRKANELGMRKETTLSCEGHPKRRSPKH